jgi:hypothetical protein
MGARFLVVGLFLGSMFMLGCQQYKAEPPPQNDKPKDTPAPPAPSKRTAMNKLDTLFLEELPDGRKRVLIESEVCLRDGILEQLMCRLQTKEHEAILHANVNAADIHTVLLLTKAKPGSVVKYQPKFEPPTGTKIKITLEYQTKIENDKATTKKVSVNARDWIRNIKTGKELETDWVFAGSEFFQDPDDPKRPPFYQANSGDVICVSNFPTAMLDVPIDSPKTNRDVSYEAWTDRIPPVGTKVTIILEPIFEDKEKKGDKK